MKLLMRISSLLGVLLLFPFCGIGQECRTVLSIAEVITDDESLEAHADRAHDAQLDSFQEKYKGKKLKVLKEKLADRKLTFETMLEEGELISSGTLYDYVRAVLDRLLAKVNVKGERRLFLVRDESMNAFNMGDNSIYVNLGLIFRASSEDELAFVLAHELGHNELDHLCERLVSTADFVTNDSIKSEIRQILHQDYKHVSALNSLMIPWILTNRERSREAERESDDYAYALLTKCGYDARRAAGIFDTFEQAEQEYDTTLLDLEMLLGLSHLESDFSDALNCNGGSSLGTFVKKEDTLAPLLRTHPFNQERKGLFIDKVGSTQDTLDSQDHAYLQYKQLALGEMIANFLRTNRVDRALFYTLHLHAQQADNCWSQRVIPFCFAYLGYEKQKRRAGKCLGLMSPQQDDSFNELLCFLREISPDQCMAIASQWMSQYHLDPDSKISNPSKAVLSLMKKDHQAFLEHYAAEKELTDNYYINTILQTLKTENQL